jgi:hypothetical protein
MTSDALHAHTRAGAKAEARKLWTMALDDERRRLADRRRVDRGEEPRRKTHIVVIPPADCEPGGEYEDLVDEPETEEE